MKKAMTLLGALALATSAYAFPTYDTFSTYGPNGTQLGGNTAPSGESWLVWTNVVPPLDGLPVITTNYFTTNNDAMLATLPAGFPGPFVAGNDTSANSVWVPPGGAALGLTPLGDVGAVLQFSTQVNSGGAPGPKIYASFFLDYPAVSSSMNGTASRSGFMGFLPNAVVSALNTTYPNNAPYCPGVAPTGSQTTPVITNWFGMDWRGNAATATAGIAGVRDGQNVGDYSTALTAAKIYFVVIAYEWGAGAGGVDKEEIWVNPSSSTFAATQPTASKTRNPSPTALSDAAGFFIESGSLLQSKNLPTSGIMINSLRIGTNWSYVTGGAQFTSQPVAGTNVNFGATVTLSASAVAAGPAVSYQWQQNGGNLSDNGRISGSSTENLTITGAQGSDAGTYTLVASTPINNSTLSSSPAVLILDPNITQQPANSLSVAPGGNTSFSVVATTIAPPLTYQWLENGLPLTNGVSGTGTTYAGSQTATLMVSTAQYADSGASYSCAVTNAEGSGTVSASASMFLSDPAIESPPMSVTNNYGTTASFSVTAGGTAPFTYSWSFNGVQLTNGVQADGATVSGATTANLTIAGVSYQDAGNYTVTVVNAVNASLTSQPATLTVIDPIIVTGPVSVTVTNGSGSPAVFNVVAQGSPTIFYRWNKNGTPLNDVGNISGSATATLTVASAGDADAGTYTVALTGANQTFGGQPPLVSAPATLTVLDYLAITNQPQSLTERVGDNLAFFVGVAGSSPTFQWEFNGSPVSGATASSLVLTNIQTTNAGTYKVVVNNVLGTLTSDPATLTVSTSLLPLFQTNLVVARVGDGDENLNTTNGNTLYLDQFNTNGNPVSTIMIPNSGASALVVEGGTPDGTFESVLTLSTNGYLLNFAGYHLSLPNNGVDFSGTTVPRSIGAIDGSGHYSIQLTNPGLYSAGSEIRSAVSTDGLVNFWTTGNGSGGLKYLTPTNGAAGIPEVTPDTDPRVIGIVNGNLYYTSAESGRVGLNMLAGLPTAAAGTPTLVISTGSGASPHGFAFSPDTNTVYIADDRAVASGGGIQRWDWNGSSYSLTYTLGTGDSGLGARGLTVDFGAFTGGGAGGVGAVLYATTAADSANQLIRIVDTSSGSPATVLATAGPKQLYRGVRFGPAASPAAIITAQVSAGQTQLVWPVAGRMASAVLQSASQVTGPYTDITPTATMPYTVTPSQTQQFFRLRIP